ncbi:MAG TPA: pyridoxamine 5'-phosphate oxidase family protein [Dehalococcoidia bacterium]|nr:pyridoxamine 5'-phosphate oxidase family protein [Dehalococcoidia bacterium]
MMTDAGQPGGAPGPEASRPWMPASYGIKAGPSPQSIDWSAVQDQLLQARNYWVATTRPNGRPHVMPVWGLWLEDGFYFGTDPDSRKGRNLDASPWAVVHLESGDDAAIIEGQVQRVRDRARLADFVAAYDAKYQIRPDVTNPNTGVYCLRPKAAFAWSERDFPNTATRWRFPAKQ